MNNSWFSDKSLRFPSEYPWGEKMKEFFITGSTNGFRPCANVLTSFKDRDDIACRFPTLSTSTRTCEVRNVCNSISCFLFCPLENLCAGNSPVNSSLFCYSLPIFYKMHQITLNRIVSVVRTGLVLDCVNYTADTWTSRVSLDCRVLLCFRCMPVFGIGFDA